MPWSPRARRGRTSRAGARPHAAGAHREAEPARAVRTPRRGSRAPRGAAAARSARPPPAATSRKRICCSANGWNALIRTLGRVRDPVDAAVLRPCRRPRQVVGQPVHVVRRTSARAGARSRGARPRRRGTPPSTGSEPTSPARRARRRERRPGPAASPPGGGGADEQHRLGAPSPLRVTSRNGERTRVASPRFADVREIGDEHGRDEAREPRRKGQDNAVETAAPISSKPTTGGSLAEEVAAVHDVSCGENTGRRTDLI